MRQGTDIHDRLLGIDRLGKTGLNVATIDMLHRDRMAAHALHRMQNDETCPIGEKVGNSRAFAFEAHRAVGGTADPGFVLELLRSCSADRLVTDGKAVSQLLNFHSFEGRIVGAPEFIADHVGHRTDCFVSLMTDVTEIASVQLYGNRSGRQQTRLRYWLIGAKQFD